MNALDKIAPYPKREEDATAATLAKATAAHAYLILARDTLDTEPIDRATFNVMVCEYGIAFLLRALIAANPEAADKAAQELWAEWDGGDGLGPDLYGWLAEWGIAGNDIAAAIQTKQSGCAR
jgi:hypothetical protein